jgi:hypothetical protein
MSGNGFFSLDGLHEKPFFLRPEGYDVLIYPAEWYGELSLNPTLTGELSDVFYTRNYGRYTVYNFWTLFTRVAFLPFFEDDVALGYRNLLSDTLPEEMPSIYYNDGFSLLQAAKLKELRTETDTFRKALPEGYTAVPLIPAALAVGVRERFELGEGYDAPRITALLSELRSFIAA